ncbi:hypothetical protein ACFW1A_04970 [Kitasatospora sp. NPDC058965]|uniref:hypothetical protein n=1 Tax=Kitasatospora sp. NPDC058965 TaxID=3346682 RepID=UPI0036B981FE
MLEAGLELIYRDLDEATRSREGILKFRWPSRDRVMRRYRIRTADATATRGLFATRWPTMDRYYADLFRLAFEPGGYAGHADLAGGLAPAVLGAGDPQDAATDVALENMRLYLDSPLFRMKLLATAMDPAGPLFGPVLVEFYEAATAWWSAAYTEITDAAGLRLKADVTPRMFASWMIALVEGLTHRFLSTPGDFDGELRAAAATLARSGAALLLGATAPRGELRSVEQDFSLLMPGSAGRSRPDADVHLVSP